jgi:hypothetical protein
VAGEAAGGPGAKGTGPEASAASPLVPALGVAPPSARRVGPPEALDVRLGGIGRTDAEDVAVTWGGVGLANARSVSVELGGLGLGIGEQVRVTQSVARTVIGGEVELEQTVSRVVIGGRVSFRRASGAIVVLAGRTDGEVRALLDWRGALAIGATIGLILRMLRRR